MSWEALLTSVDGGVARITLNRPEARNALSRTLIRELGDALAAFESDPAARVIVLAGAGDKAFCAGADLKGLGDRGTTLEARESFGGLARILESIPHMKKPVIAQVHGFALAGGCGLAVGCDLSIASDDAVFGLPEITLGMLPLIVMAPILRAAGRKRAMLMVLSGERVSAREAFEMGLVSRVVPRADLEREATAVATRMAGFSPTALALAKEAAAVAQDMEYGKSLHYLRELTTLVSLSDDVKEGITAFFARRKPEWKGR
ncbi:MAG TPA: enoyl-CoA hydratase/isomerase family protein [Methylomirabilota bacterium]|nr:enoyl-CoA hydratase/isomerase family protein [Methylomirabilota bacterium]